MIPRSLVTLLTCSLLAGGAGGLAAQTRQPPPDCKGASHRQFDFWVGDWVVFVNGDTAGTNRVTLEESGCVVHEHWVGRGGGSGQSFNFFDRADQKWHQLWVSSSGMVLRLAGDYADGQIRYSGESKRPDGTSIRHRLTFFNNKDGTVRQFWESSTDGGTSWSSVFDGIYRKK
jgi:hypothetical protein